ncbi:MAG: hypothetical protein JWM78_1561 [Verrucomicrobiaceae bacterium]|nr:hypothetical protein [Verrucomicrobiaceae bacterium]
MNVSSAPLARLQERCRPVLQQFVQALFDQADDALFELADRAANNAEQNMYFESMREVRIKRRGIEQALMRDMSENFRCLALGVSAEDGIGSYAMDDAAAANLSLVDHDQLEEMVAVDGMIAKAEKEFADALALLTARIDSLLPYPVNVKTNPLGPARLCQSFVQATQALELDIKAKLVLFKLFDRHVVKSLSELYEAANNVLIEEGVLPKLKRGGVNSSKAQLPNSPLRDDSEAEQVFSSLQQLLDQSRPGMEYTPLDQRSGLVAPGLAPALPRDALMQMLADIQQQQIAWLARQQAAVMRGVAPQQLDVLQALNRVLQQRLPDRTVSIGQVDDDAINLVSMLFQFVLEDRNLAAPIKGLIARLQIPILKVAMLDKTFFGKGGHPARKLLNEIANASLGWAPVDPTAHVERDPFYAKVEMLVARVIDEFAGDVGVFQTALEDFIAFVEMDRRRASLIEQRTIDAEDGRAKSEMARATVQELLNQKVAGKRLPPVVVKLLQDGWSNVLFLVCLKEGLESESWERGVQTVDDLLESVSAVDSLADRARLLRMLPTLLKNLRSGLNKIGFNPFDLNQLFTDLEQIHLQRLKKEETADLVARNEPHIPAVVEPPVVEAPIPVVISAPVPPVIAATAAPAISSQTLDEVLQSRQQQPTLVPESTVARAPVVADDLADLDRELAEHFGEDFGATYPEAPATVAAAVAEPAMEVTARSVSVEVVTDSAEVQAAPQVAVPTVSAEPLRSREDRAIERVNGLQVGNWVEFQQGGGKMLRCRLAAIIRATGKYIFVNRAGVKVTENNRDGLLHAYLRGDLILLDEGRLFDRALESVIGNLRDMKTRPNS